MMNSVNGLVDWNAVAAQQGLNSNYVSAPNLTPPPQYVGPSFSGGDTFSRTVNPGDGAYIKPKDKTFGGVATTLALAAAAITTVVLARKGKIFKSGKFGGKFGDWIRSIGNNPRRELAKTIKDARTVLKDPNATDEAKKAAKETIKNAIEEGKKFAKQANPKPQTTKPAETVEKIVNEGEKTLEKTVNPEKQVKPGLPVKPTSNVVDLEVKNSLLNKLQIKQEGIEKEIKQINKQIEFINKLNGNNGSVYSKYIEHYKQKGLLPADFKLAQTPEGLSKQLKHLNEILQKKNKAFEDLKILISAELKKPSKPKEVKLIQPNLPGF